MREPTRRAKIFAAAAQRARLTRRMAAPVSQRSEERWVLVDIDRPDVTTTVVSRRMLSLGPGRYLRPSAKISAARAVDSVYSAATRCAPALAAPSSASDSSMMLPTPAV
jgi:hypothetical protein